MGNLCCRWLGRRQNGLEKGLRLGRARDESTISRNQNLYDDFEKAFQLISARLGGLKLMDIFEALSDEQIVRARNEIRLFFLIAEMAELPNVLAGGFGLKTLADLSRQIPFRTAQVMLLFLAALKEDGLFKEGVDNAIENFRMGRNSA